MGILFRLGRRLAQIMAEALLALWRDEYALRTPEDTDDERHERAYRAWAVAERQALAETTRDSTPNPERSL